MAEFTLRNKIEQGKDEYLKKYGMLDWHWNDEGLVWIVQDYHGSMGSVLDFTEDDWRVCKENGLTLPEVLMICDCDEDEAPYEANDERLAVAHKVYQNG